MEHEVLKQHIRARVRAQLNDDLEGFNSLSEQEKTKVIDNYILALFENYEPAVIPYLHNREYRELHFK